MAGSIGKRFMHPGAASIFLFVFILLSQDTFFGQTYDDVLAVVNSNSAVSRQIGSHFKEARSIPEKNICAIGCPADESIDSLAFEQIRLVIENHLSVKKLSGKINYIVTTKGVPLKVKRFGTTFSPYTRSSSLDAELTMICSKIASKIANQGGVANPFFGSTASFSRKSFPYIYLVTRLDGYRSADVKALIDRGTEPYVGTGRFAFDQDPAKDSPLNDNMLAAKNTLSSRGYHTLLNATSQIIVEQADVLGYVSWGSNDGSWQYYTQKGQPLFTWSPKALAETYVSSSGRSFDDSTFIDPDIGAWQSLVSDLVHENGGTGAKAYVFEPNQSALARVDILFDRWARPTDMKTFNLAESFYASSPYIGWMDVVIGDPKALFAADGYQSRPVRASPDPGLRDASTIKPAIAARARRLSA